MKVGFIGLGNLGKAIVDRMISQGLELYVYNRTIEKAKSYNYYEDPNELFKNCDIIFIIIKDSRAVEELLFNKVEIQNLKDKIIIDMTTNSYQFVIYAYKKIKNLNGYYFEAPLLGSIPAAQDGNLVMLIYGDSDKFEKIEDIIKTFTRKIYYFDELGKPTKIKLLNNFALAGISHSIIETITIAQKLSIEKEIMLDILLNGAGRSYFLEIKKDKLLTENFQPHFSIELLHKDLNYFFELINQFHIYSHILEPVNKTLKRAINLSYGNLDISAIYLVLKEKIFNDERFIEGIKLFQENKFFEAHEVLEEFWREIPKENKYRNFIKALIQISAGYYKYLVQKNKDGAIKIFTNAKNYLLEYQEEKTIFNIRELLRNIEFLIELIEKNEDISSFKII